MSTTRRRTISIRLANGGRTWRLSLVPDAKKSTRPADFERVARERPDSRPASWCMQPDGTFWAGGTPIVGATSSSTGRGSSTLPATPRPTRSRDRRGVLPVVVKHQHPGSASTNWDGRRLMRTTPVAAPGKLYEHHRPQTHDRRRGAVGAGRPSSATFGAPTCAVEWKPELGKHIAIQARRDPGYFLQGACRQQGDRRTPSRVR